MTTEPTLAQALGAQGITIYPGDLVSPDLQAPTNAWTHVFIKRTKGLTVEVDQRLKRHRTFAKTIAEALTEAGIEIGPLDRVEPGLPSRLDDEASIRIVRVKEEFITEEAIIPRTTIYQPDSELELDQQRVNEGSDGLRRWITKIVYEDGTEVSRSTERAWIERGPVNKVVRYGTNIVIRTIDTPEGTLEYWRRMNVLATWYDASHGGKPRDHPQYGRTRLGYIAQKGIVAVDPNVISMLTRMYIPGYGIGLAADTGGAIKGRHIDVAYSEGEPHNWGLRRLDIYLLTPISPEDTIRWILP